MKIGILSTCESYAWAGTEEVWYHFAETALSEGHDVVLAAHHLVAESEQVATLQRKGLKICVRRPRKPLRLYIWKEQLRSQMRLLETCDVVIVNAGSLFDSMNLPWIGGMVTRLRTAGTRLIYFCHFCAESLPASVHHDDAIETLISQFDEWVFVSDHNRRLARRQLAAALPDARVVINGPRLYLDQPLAMPDGPVTLGCVARLETRWKGHDVLIGCMADQQLQDLNIRLNIYGSGPDESYIRKLIDHYDVSNRVRLRGYVRDVTKVWSECHAMAMASHGEGTPLAVLEAMMCGRVTITTDVGGNHEILKEGITGFIADAATPRCFQATLARALHKKDQWQDLGCQAHVDARKLAEADPAKQLLKIVVQAPTGS